MKASEIESILRYLPTKDRHTAQPVKTVGRPRLTLRHLNALNKQRDALRLEQEIHLQQVRDMYGPDAALEESAKDKARK